MESRPPIHLSVVAIEKRAFKSPSNKVANFTYFLLGKNYLRTVLCIRIKTAEKSDQVKMQREAESRYGLAPG